MVFDDTRRTRYGFLESNQQIRKNSQKQITTNN